MAQEIIKDNYEIAFWMKDETDSPVKKLFTKHGAEIIREKPIQKMRLSFPIKKENFAFLSTLIFRVSPEAINGLISNLNLETAILRYFLRKAKKPSVENRSAIGEAGETAFKERRSFFHLRGEGKKEETQVLTNEALEKKIEEILK